MKSIAKFGIPVQALAIAVTTLGCESTDPMIGDFVCTFFAYNGAVTTCPYENSYSENGLQYDFYNTTELSVREEGTGTFTQVVELRVDGTIDPEFSYVNDYAVSATQIADGVWDLSIPQFYGLNMECTATVADATCYGTDVDGANWEFNFAPVSGDVIL